MGQPSVSARQNASTRIYRRVWCRRVVIPGLTRRALELIERAMSGEALYG